MFGSGTLRRRVARDAGAAAAATAAGAGAWWATSRLLNSQAAEVRRIIPHRTENGPYGDGVYLPDGTGPHRVRRDEHCDLHLTMFGDSTAAGLGADTPDSTPGVILARRIAAETGKSVRYSNKAIVGATSRGLAAQVDAMLIAKDRPDVSVILIGANDVTATNGIRSSAQRLGATVARLREVGSEVVVGTCPDFGVVTTIPQPLRSVLRAWGLRLAAAQRGAVRGAGGHAVPMADVMAKEFLAQPDHMFSPDRFHPSAAGYALAADILLPEVLAAIGEWGSAPLPQPPELAESVETGRLTHKFLRVVRDVH